MFAPHTATALIDIVLPQDCPAADRPVIMASAEKLIERRIACLSLPMRTAVLGLLVLFEYSSLLTSKKVFSKNTATERRSHVASAENWPLIPFRELVKLFRSLTLLAFYDHPLTRARLGFVPGGLRVAA